MIRGRTAVLIVLGALSCRPTDEGPSLPSALPLLQSQAAQLPVFARLAQPMQPLAVETAPQRGRQFIVLYSGHVLERAARDLGQGRRRGAMALRTIRRQHAGTSP